MDHKSARVNTEKRREYDLDSFPPYRTTPETAGHLFATCLAVSCVPAAAGMLFFGSRAGTLVLIAAGAAWVAENVAGAFRGYRQSGSAAHSMMLGVVLALMLPVTAPWHAALVGGAVTVLLGKQCFGGVGHYLWHPVLVGRVILEYLYSGVWDGSTGPLLARGRMLVGDCGAALPVEGWFHFDWFLRAAPAGADGYQLPIPEAALREFSALGAEGSGEVLANYLTEHLPPLSHCILGCVPGGIGETSALCLLLVGMYLVYRGYVPWLMPAAFIGAVCVAAAVLPIPLRLADGTVTGMVWPISAGHWATEYTYVNYHLFSGGTLLAAFLLAMDTTARPIARPGQLIFALGGGLLTVVLRLYTPLATPAYAAVLVMDTLIWPIDRWTRPRKRRVWPWR